MEQLGTYIIAAVVSGIVSGLFAGAAAVLTMRVEIRWLKEVMGENRESAKHAHHRIDQHLREDHRHDPCTPSSCPNPQP